MLMFDKIDYKILDTLQNNARITNIELSEKVGISPSPCLRRVKRLEKVGAIKGYVAILDQKLIGLPINIFIQVSLIHQDEDTLIKFEQAVKNSPEVLEAYLMTGNSDYLLRVVSKDLTSYEIFLKRTLTKVKGIGNIRSSFALKKVKDNFLTPILFRKT